MLRQRNRHRTLFSSAESFALFLALACAWVGSLCAQELRWPKTRTNAGGQLVMYQPQIDDWQNFQVVDGRMAFTITPAAGKEHPGVATVRMHTSVDMDNHVVTLTNPEITSLYFPSLDPATTAQMDKLVRSFLNPSAKFTISVDQLAASVKKKEPPKAIQVKNDPPVIFVSVRPAILLMVNGPPVLAPVGQTNIKAVVNANWPLFQDQVTSTYYLFDGKGWLQGPNFENWSPTATLPAAMSQVTLSPNWSDLQQFIPPPPGSTNAVPAVFYSARPAEIVVFNGRPEWIAIPGTQLSYPANTDSTVLRYNPTNTFYFLASGRWFSATSPLGPWTFATNDLPADFKRIPPDSPAGKVLTFVPGTQEAEDAVLLAQVPTTATVNATEAPKEVQVSYAGQPQFEPIQGTTMYYAVNTPNRVIQVGSQYYLCYQGLWFYGGTPNGPWVVAQTVPPVIYTIPPSSPVYNVTYVTQVQSSPGYVTSSYTAGYVGTFIAGMAVGAICAGGTGWYYPPYAYGGFYYPYAATYGYHTAYNPYTGAYGYGGSAYGPYGSAHWGESYNPNTGTYARGASASTAYGSRAAGQAYNPYTGAYAATRQGSNAYGSWGQSVYSKNGETAYTQHASNAYGSVGTAQTSAGGKAAASSTAYGNTAVGKSSSGNMYADHNGNVYQNTGSGWEKYDNGSWNSVNKSTAQQTYNQEHPNTSSNYSSNEQQHPSSTGSTSSTYHPSSESSYSHPSGSSSSEVDQAAQDRSRGDTQSQRFSDYQHSSSGWGGDHSGGFGGGGDRWGGGGDRWGGGGAAGRGWGGRR